MSFVSNIHTECSSSRRSVDADSNGYSERDETKRRSRNLSEKKRRDQFNILINELSTMVSCTARKMDKSNILKATISFLKQHNEMSAETQIEDNAERCKPSFLSNEEFTYLMLEASHGFIIVISSSGKIVYAGESITSLLGHLPSDLVRQPIYNFILPEETSKLCNFLNGSTADETGKQKYSSILLKMRIGGLDPKEDKFRLVKLTGYMKPWISSDSSGDDYENEGKEDDSDSQASKMVFICTGRVVHSSLLREMSVVVDSMHTEFLSRHSLEWKFLFLDHRAPPIIGYLPFEVLGTSGYDYYHMDDLEKVATCHEILMQKGEGTSCHYRFLTKGQQWIWLQSRYYLTYHQWNSKPEFIVGTHRVVSYEEVMKELRAQSNPLGRTSVQLFAPVGKTGKSSASQRSIASSGSSERFSTTTVGLTKRSPVHQSRNLPPKFYQNVSFGISTQGVSSPTDVQSSSRHNYHLSPLPNEISYSNLLPANSMPGIRTHLAPFETSPVPISPPAAPSSFHLRSLSKRTTPETEMHQALTGPTESLPTQITLQEQLIKRQEELQRHINEQQEELRRISEQLVTQVPIKHQ